MSPRSKAWVGNREATAALQRRVVEQIGSEFVFLNLRDLDASWPGYRAMATESVSAAMQLGDLQEVDYFRQWLFEEMGALLEHQYLTTSVPVDINRISATLNLSGPIEIKRLIEAGWQPQDAWLSAMRRSAHVMAGIVHEQGQNTFNDLIAGHSAVLQGWRRIISPTACEFCQNLSRVVWQPTDRWVKPHDFCGCTAEPVPGDFRVVRGVIADRKRKAARRLAAANPAA